MNNVKEYARLRAKKLSNGNESLYLDINVDGRRRYEYLRLYLIPSTAPNAKLLNGQTMKAARAIQAQRIMDITSGKAGISNTVRGDMALYDFMQKYYETRMTQKNNRVIFATLGHIAAYSGKRTKMKDVTPEYCKGFINYLTTARSRRGNRLAKSTEKLYFQIFTTAMNAAVRAGIIQTNPVQRLDPSERIKVPESTRAYLTLDELRMMIEAHDDNNKIERAYLFSCFCGLRISDIRALRWEDIETDGDKQRIKIIQQKTKSANYLPLSESARKWLPERPENGTGAVFNLIEHHNTITSHINNWARRAGITKHITFHSARHTFATALLTKGADLYTTSKLLGHTNITTTQIYAKIVDAKKVDAVNMLNDIF